MAAEKNTWKCDLNELRKTENDVILSMFLKYWFKEQAKVVQHKSGYMIKLFYCALAERLY